MRKAAITMMLAMLLVPMVLVRTVSAPTVGFSDNGILVEQWRYDMQQMYTTLVFGSSSAIADIGVNNVGGEPNSDLEIMVGSDEYSNLYPELGGWANGIWRLLDSHGNLEWAKNTGTDESRSSPNIADINGDGYLDIVGGTTSGWNVEAMDRFGNWEWTFPWPPQQGGPFMFHSSPAVGEVDSSVSGLEVFIGSRTDNPGVWALDGDNSDGVNDGITATDWWIYGGTEGTDWDVLWKYPTGTINSSPALGDVDKDGVTEVVIGSEDQNIYVLNGITGALEWSYATGSVVEASAALANLDSDASLEIVIGSGDGNIYCLDGSLGTVEWTYPTGNPVYSSAAIGDVDGDSGLEIVDASTGGDVYALSASGSVEWTYTLGGGTVSSPALADRVHVSPYDMDWPMFRHDSKRTGLSGNPLSPSGLDVYIGSDDHYLYLIEGGGGGGGGGALIDRFETYGKLYTSPSVADIDGDRRFEVVLYDAEPGRWDPTAGGGLGAYEYTYWCIEDKAKLCVYFDIKPGSWPNPINLVSRGVLPVAICGTEDFDVTTIDPATVKLTREGLDDGVSPIRWDYEDVATPWTGEPGGGHDLGGDGYFDLTLKFKTQEVVATLGLDAFETQVIPLMVIGNLKEVAGGTPIEGQDFVWILKLHGDSNDDMLVNLGDIAVLSAHWYPGPPMGVLGYDAASDLNGDGFVNIADVTQVSANWGQFWQP